MRKYCKQRIIMKKKCCSSSYLIGLFHDEVIEGHVSEFISSFFYSRSYLNEVFTDESLFSSLA